VTSFSSTKSKCKFGCFCRSNKPTIKCSECRISSRWI
jgi:hypothetical protein